ncbi:hypothetical protein JXA40_05835 [bacterium]|nr:hypothetical protein [candidate division CSSED10-310 bacterium]
MVQIVDVATFTSTGSIPVGTDPWGIDITSDDKTLVVACEDAHNVYIIDTTTHASTIIPLLGTDTPRDVDILAGDNDAFIASGTSDTVIVIDLTIPAVDTTIVFPGASTSNAVSVEPQIGSYVPATPTPSITPTPTPVPDTPVMSTAGLVLLLAALSGLLLFRRRSNIR